MKLSKMIANQKRIRSAAANSVNAQNGDKILKSSEKIETFEQANAQPTQADEASKRSNFIRPSSSNTKIKHVS